MVTLPDQASFNARFLNGIPSEWKREMITHDRIRVDFSSPSEMILAASHIDEVIDGLKMASAYRLGTYTRYTTNTVTTSCKKPAYHAERNCRQEGAKPHLTDKRKSKEKTPQRHLGKTDQRSVLLCNKCRKPGQTADCPIHQTLSENKPRQIATMETTYKAEDELGSTPERTSEPSESKAESFEVEDPLDLN